MCKDMTPREPVDTPSILTFSDTADLLAAIRPGMELCTSDFTGWASVEAVRTGTGETPGSVLGRRREDGAAVEVPADELIDIRGGHCVRIDRVRARIDAQGWEIPAPEQSVS